MARYAEKIESIALRTLEITCYLFPLEEWERDDLVMGEEWDDITAGEWDDAAAGEWGDAVGVRFADGNPGPADDDEWDLDDEEMPGKNGSEGERIRALIGFEGPERGCMLIDASGDLADAIASNMLGADQVTRTLQEGALCEVANIICGNTVPLFARDGKICRLQPPRAVGPEEDPEELLLSTTVETRGSWQDQETGPDPHTGSDPHTGLDPLRSERDPVKRKPDQSGMIKETVQLFFDEGEMEITIWYTQNLQEAGE